MSNNKLTIALTVEGEYVSAWQYLMLQRLLAIQNVELLAVIFHAPMDYPLSQKTNWALLKILRLVDGLIFNCPAKAQEAKSFIDLLGDTYLCDMHSKRYMQLITQQTVDLVIDLTGRIFTDELIAWPTYGVWRHFYGNPAMLGDCYVGVREYMARQAEIISGIERLTSNRSEPELLFYATTSTHQASISRNIESTLWKMVDFIPQRVQELITVGAEKFFQHSQTRAKSLPIVQEYTYKPLPVLLMVGVLARYPFNFLHKLYKVAFRSEQWVLLVGKQQTKLDAYHALNQFRKLMPPRDRFWADPFVVDYQNEQYVFFEEFVYAEGKGHIACLQMSADGSHSQPTRVLDQPYHLSYPFIFAYKNQLYLIPESACNRTVELYRCEQFPHQWVFEKTLMQNIEAYDATLLNHAGKWWMFMGMRPNEHCSPNEALYLFYADCPLSTDWQAHPQNPVVSQASHARPAGAIFEENGKLYRPSQNCVGAYGRGLNLNVIQHLDAWHYWEETISCVLPEGAFDIDGMHTLGVSNDLAVSDAVHVHRRLGMFDRWLTRFNRWQPRFFNQSAILKRQLIALASGIGQQIHG